VPEQHSPLAGLSGRYAIALFELARDAKVLDSVADDLTELARMIDTSDDLKRLVRSLVFDREEQGRAMAALAERAGFADLTRRYIGMVTENRRLFALRDAITAFHRLVAEHRDEVTARVTTAGALTPAQESDLARALKAALGGNVNVETAVDRNILGGLVVRVGSRMVDTSIATKLSKIHTAMKEA
jgi:F-type H+-transporting ATPase subunit delta